MMSEGWGKVREENLNVMLAELLAESGLKAIGEVVIQKRMPDVLVNINGVRVIIEGKRIGARKQLIEDACKRIDNALCDVVMMIEYKNLPLEGILIDQKEIKKALRRGTYNVGFLTYLERSGLAKWIPELREEVRFDENVSFQDLMAYLIQVYDIVIKETSLNKFVSEIEKKIYDFSERVMMDRPNISRLKEVLELVEREENEKR